MAARLLSHAARPALTYPGILEVPSQAHKTFVSITAKEPQLHNCKTLKSDSTAVAAHKMANYCKKP